MYYMLQYIYISCRDSICCSIWMCTCIDDIHVYEYIKEMMYLRYIEIHIEVGESRSYECGMSMMIDV